MINPHILVMDSGAGGLSVTAEIRQLLPLSSVTYLADLAFFPYGIKSEEEIVGRVIALFAGVHTRTPVDIAVLACNTASTIALEALRSRFPVLFVGVVPAVKPAAALSRSGYIGILATEGTVNRSYTQQLIAQHASHCRILLKGSRTLVQLAEMKLRGVTIDQQVVAEELSCFSTSEATAIDTIVLACTHFPLIKQELATALPGVMHWVDSGEAIARRVVHLSQGLTDSKHSILPNRMMTTGSEPPAYKEDLVRRFIGNYEVVPFSE